MTLPIPDPLIDTPVPKNLALIVEDDPSVACLAAIALGDLYEVQTFDTKREAIASLAARPAPELVVLDLTLRNGSGLGLIKDFRLVVPRTAIVVITGGDYTWESALTEGAQEFLKKPFTSKDLLESAARAVVRQKMFIFKPIEKKLRKNSHDLDRSVHELDQVLARPDTATAATEMIAKHLLPREEE